MIDNLSITVHTFARLILTSLSKHETLLLRYVNMCYITYAIDFRFIPSDPVCFDKLSRD